MSDPTKWKIVKVVKSIQDPVHGVIELDPLANKIIDTSEFQRLRFIKQLGCMDYVYPGATHTRFAHSIGVYHLACKMIEAVRKSIPVDENDKNDIKMEDWEEECVRVAALCHDLGHGPFCHIYEELCREKDGITWNHRDLSCSMVRRIFKKDDIRDEMISKDKTKSIRLILRLIVGKKISNMSDSEKRRAYMFQIIENMETSVDVDKWDYLCRDALHCGLSERFLTDRAILGARVVLTSKSGEPVVHQIGYPEKDALMFYNMFQTRYTLYRYIYRHRVGVGMNIMIRDILYVSDLQERYERDKRDKRDERDERSNVFSFELFPIKETTKIPDDDAALDQYIDSNDGKDQMDKYVRLTDDIISRVRYISEQNGLASGEHIAHAVQTLKRIDNRCFYKLHCEMHLKRGTTLTVAKEKLKQLTTMLKEKNASYTEYVHNVLMRFNLGNEDEDPMTNMRFYNKRNSADGIGCLLGNPLDATKVPYLPPNCFSDYYIRIYVKLLPVPIDFESVIQTFSDQYKGQDVDEE